MPSISKELSQTINDLVIPGKGILAADESTGTIGKRFESIKVENTVENRQRYRSLLASTEDLGNHISGVILFEETLQQSTDKGKSIPQEFIAKKIVPGIKVDQGLIAMENFPNDKITQGLDGLAQRLAQYKKQGARFAKWRNVFNITSLTPNRTVILANAEVHARYAAICQSLGIVPIVEPEVLMDGNHTLERCAEVTAAVLNETFYVLKQHNIVLEHIILKPNMVIPGKDCSDQSNPEAIAEATLRVFRNHVPAAVPSINFLSGGQTSKQATVNLNAINSLGKQPWYLSFSYGRALQDTCLKTWAGSDKKYSEAQMALAHRAKLNGCATVGKYAVGME